MAQLRWQKPANGSETLAIAQIRWQRTVKAVPSIFRGALTCEKFLGGSGWVRGRLIALALIRGSHRLSAARSARVDQDH